MIPLKGVNHWPVSGTNGRNIGEDVVVPSAELSPWLLVDCWTFSLWVWWMLSRCSLACCIVWLFHIFLSSSMSVSESRVPSRVSLAPLGLLSCPMASAAPGAELWEPEEGATPSVWQCGGCWWSLLVGVLGCSWLGCLGRAVLLAGSTSSGFFSSSSVWLPSAAWGSWRRVCTDWDEPPDDLSSCCSSSVDCRSSRMGESSDSVKTSSEIEPSMLWGAVLALS